MLRPNKLAGALNSIGLDSIVKMWEAVCQAWASGLLPTQWAADTTSL